MRRLYIQVQPKSHEQANWVLGGHGKQATVAGEKPNTFTVAASCATCHARNQCITCHVNPPEVQPIQALGLDDRAPELDATIPAPASHAATNWDRSHGAEARKGTTSCSTCHARESCRTCHAAPGPRPLQKVPSTGAGRGAGVQLTRTPPASHTFEFRDRHGPAASATGGTCETCHVRESCLSCHRPNTAGSGTYNPNGFLTRHPSSAWSRAFYRARTRWPSGLARAGIARGCSCNCRGSTGDEMCYFFFHRMRHPTFTQQHDTSATAATSVSFQGGA